ncbi:MAG: Gfo/Idh/MocA family oxidoreductase [Promethearchaeati archaeon SRVP18_Atabeyarchaeia-1]
MTLRCAVIGAGWFGRAHCRVYRDLINAQLVAVADADSSRANEVAQIYSCKPYTDAIDMVETERPDAVSIAVSPQNLSKVASKVIEHKIGGVLVEKPIATSLQEVTELLNKSKKREVPVMPGFIELFNPCIERLEEAIKKNNEVGQPYVASSKRIGRNPKRGWDIGVLLDLGIHEIYVLRKLFGSPRRIFCQTKSYGGGKTEDVANLIIEFDNGVLGMIETNWITPIGIRSMIVTGSEGSVEVDYITQELKMIKKDRTIKPHFAFEEPLKRELKAFTESIEKGEDPPVNLVDAEESLKVAFAALNSARQMQVVAL